MDLQYYKTKKEASKAVVKMKDHGWPNATVLKWTEGYVIRAMGDEDYAQYLQANGFVN